MRLLTLALTGMVALAGCGPSDQEDRPTDRPAAQSSARFAPAAQEAVSAVGAGGALLLDVRTDAEYAAGHAVDAMHVPLDGLQAGDRPDIAKDRAVYVYCTTGRRAAIATAILRDDGFENVVNIGGLADWKQADGDVVD